MWRGGVLRRACTLGLHSYESDREKRIRTCPAVCLANRPHDLQAQVLREEGEGAHRDDLCPNAPPPTHGYAAQTSHRYGAQVEIGEVVVSGLRQPGQRRCVQRLGDGRDVAPLHSMGLADLGEGCVGWRCIRG